MNYTKKLFILLLACTYGKFQMVADGSTPPKEKEPDPNGQGALSLTSPSSWTYENGILIISSRFEELQTVVINGVEYSASGYECQIEIKLSEGEYPITILTESHSYEGTLCVD